MCSERVTKIKCTSFWIKINGMDDDWIKYFYLPSFCLVVLLLVSDEPMRIAYFET
jgi:hypothetical protein